MFIQKTLCQSSEEYAGEGGIRIIESRAVPQLGFLIAMGIKEF